MWAAVIGIHSNSFPIEGTLAVSKNIAIDSKSQESFMIAAEAQDFDHRDAWGIRMEKGARGSPSLGFPLTKEKDGVITTLESFLQVRWCPSVRTREDGKKSPGMYTASNFHSIFASHDQWFLRIIFINLLITLRYLSCTAIYTHRDGATVSKMCLPTCGILKLSFHFLFFNYAGAPNT